MPFVVFLQRARSPGDLYTMRDGCEAGMAPTLSLTIPDVGTKSFFSKTYNTEGTCFAEIVTAITLHR